MSVSEPYLNRTASLSNEDNVSKLQQQIEYHLRIVYDLRYKINQYAAISRLPPEMLSRIFYFARDECNDHPSTPARVVRWIVVTHVCRHWRDVATNEHGLWAVLPLQLPIWTTEMLRRSQEASLSVSIDPFIIKSDIVSKVLGQAHRLAHLTLRSESSDAPLEKVFVGCGSLHVPRLRKLCLERDFSPTAPLLLPEGLFYGTVKLRHLELLQVDISWYSHLLKDLTTLVLEDTSSKPSWSQFRSMLQRMPELQCLTLRQTLPSEPPEKKYTASPIHLPYLKTLCIDGEAVNCRSFFDMVLFYDCLETSKYRLRTREQATAADICHLLSSADHIASGKSLSASAQSLWISGVWNDSQPLNLSFYTANGLFDLSTPEDVRSSLADNLPGLSFGIWEGTTSRRLGNIYDEIITGVFQASHFQTLLELDLQTLWVSKSMPRFRDTLAATYATLPILHTVIVGYDTASYLIDILSFRSDKQGDGDMTDGSDAPPSGEAEDSVNVLEPGPQRSSSATAFPALRNLKICEVTFAGRECDLELDDLKKCLITRSRCGLAILSLVLERCERISSEDVAELRNLVPHVHWDGEGDDEFEESDEDS